MIWGLTTETFTTLHTVISLVGIVSGLIVLAGLLNGRLLRGWNPLFLVSTIATSVTGFAFPFTFDHLLPSHKVGFLSLAVLAVALVALYGGHLAGAWRRTYVICAMVALYLNCFVLVVMIFRNVPFLHALAPTEKEPPFAIAQLLVLVLFAVLTVLAARRFRGASVKRA